MDRVVDQVLEAENLLPSAAPPSPPPPAAKVPSMSAGRKLPDRR